MVMIDALWSDLRSQVVLPVHRRLSADSGMELYAQLDELRREGLLAISAVKPKPVPEFSSVDVQVRARADGQWATSVSLTESSLKPLFTTMCDEILRDASLAAPADAGAFLLASLLRWQKLLALGTHGLLSESAQAGLFGELHLLRQAVESFEAGVALDAWVGPVDAPQDFSLPFGLVEVKSVKVGARELSISSIDQLDVEGHPLFLVVVQLSTATREGTGLTLYGMISGIRELLATDIPAATEFERKLVSVGYRDSAAYDQRVLSVSSEQWYRVGEGFPRLLRRNVAPEITAAVYRISLAAIGVFTQHSELT